jgi:rRNA maturation endonuclease Nob1
MVVKNHFLKGYQCYICGHNLSKIENVNRSFAIQLGLRCGDNRLLLRHEYDNILKHHIKCEKCGLIICRSCLQNIKNSVDWHNRPYCPKCGSEMVYI